MRVTSFLVALVILTPLFAFGVPDCSSLPLQATPAQSARPNIGAYLHMLATLLWCQSFSG